MSRSRPDRRRRPTEGPTTYRGLQLDDFQRDAIEGISLGESVFVAAPTGTGKTLIAEYAIDRALQEGRRIVYTSPIKALSNQKYRDFSMLYPGQVGITTGDVSIRPDAPALIMTTEIFRNTIFESPERLKDVTYVIYDEVHYMDDADRGTVWEESIIFAPEQIGIIALSATVSNLQLFCDWIEDVRACTLRRIVETHRPVPLDIHVATVGGRIERWEEAELIRPSARERYKQRETMGHPLERVLGHARKLVSSIHDLRELPLLFFLFSRSACERMAEECLDEDFFENEEDRQSALSDFDALLELYRIDRGELGIEPLRRAMSCGVSYHHAGLLPIAKEIVERLFAKGHVRVLFATETFSLGVNMPARSVAFESLRKFNGKARVPLESRQFLQMAGRAGRRGIDDAGSVFLSYDPLFDQPRTAKRIVEGELEPVVSKFNLSYATILNLFGHLGTRLPRACERSFANYCQQREQRDSGKGGKSKRAKKGKDDRHNRFERRGRRGDRHQKGGRGRRGRRQDSRRGDDGPSRPEEFHGMVEVVERKLDLCEELGYIKRAGDSPLNRLTERGRFAAQIYGSELVATELVFQGVLDQLPPEKLCLVFTAMVFESRPDRGGGDRINPKKLLGKTVGRAERVVEHIHRRERALGLPEPSRGLDWNLTPAVHAWATGAEFEQVRELTSASDGDIVRNLRQAIQLMRMVSFPLTSPSADTPPQLTTVGRRIQVAVDLLKRDLVDAEWQLRIEEEEEGEEGEDKADAKGDKPSEAAAVGVPVEAVEPTPTTARSDAAEPARDEPEAPPREVSWPDGGADAAVTFDARDTRAHEGFDTSGLLDSDESC